jgi:hypothetical protein
VKGGELAVQVIVVYDEHAAPAGSRLGSHELGADHLQQQRQFHGLGQELGESAVAAAQLFQARDHAGDHDGRNLARGLTPHLRQQAQAIHVG